MKLAHALPLLAAFLTLPLPRPQIAGFLYTRALTIAPTPAEATAACTSLDATVFTHAAPTLTDLRLFAGAPGQATQELPYALTLSETTPAADPARILNRGVHARHIVFDLAMPPRPYTHVNLDLAAQDFVLNARVTGLRAPGDQGTYLGTFTLFDLSAQSLARNTTLPLSESTFPYLHVDLDVISEGNTTQLTPLDPEIIHAATVPASREAETLYTTVAATPTVTQRDRESIATFTLPAHLPVERIAFTLPPNPPNFSRTVSIRARAQGEADAMTESLTGEISHIKLTQHAQHLTLDTLAVPATVGSNAQAPATLEVAVDNGDDQPLPITQVRLEMRERRLCFSLPSPTSPAQATSIALLYGAPTLKAPQYDFSRTFNPATPTRKATLSPEQPNPFYNPTTQQRPFTERHPALLWLALLAVIALLGLTALQTAKRLP